MLFLVHFHISHNFSFILSFFLHHLSVLWRFRNFWPVLSLVAGLTIFSQVSQHFCILFQVCQHPLYSELCLCYLLFLMLFVWLSTVFRLCQQPSLHTSYFFVFKDSKYDGQRYILWHVVPYKPSKYQEPLTKECITSLAERIVGTTAVKPLKPTSIRCPVLWWG